MKRDALIKKLQAYCGGAVQRFINSDLALEGEFVRVDPTGKLWIGTTIMYDAWKAGYCGPPLPVLPSQATVSTESDDSLVVEWRTRDEEVMLIFSMPQRANRK